MDRLALAGSIGFALSAYSCRSERTQPGAARAAATSATVPIPADATESWVPVFSLAAEGRCSLDVLAIPGAAFLRVGRKAVGEQLLHIDLRGVHDDDTLQQGLPGGAGFIEGGVTLGGYWPNGARLKWLRTTRAEGGAAFVNRVETTYRWGNGYWVLLTNEKAKPEVDGERLCGEATRYNGLVRVHQIELPTGDTFVVGNCQWLGSKAPSMPPRVVVAAFTPNGKEPSTWILPNTESLDPYMTASLDVVSSTEFYVTAQDRRTRRAYAAELRGTTVVPINVPFDGPVTALVGLWNRALLLSTGGRLAARTPDGRWLEIALPRLASGDTVNEVGRLDGVGIWLTTTTTDGVRRVFTSHPVEHVYDCPPELQVR